MPGKSRRKRGRYSSRAKQGGGRLTRPAMVEQPAAVVHVGETVSVPKVSAPAASAATAKTTAVSYPYVTTELRVIGILAGFMLIILVVLALVWD